MLCDGLGMCRAPSCKDIGAKLKPEEQRAVILFFEFVAGLDHSFHITSQAVQDHYRHILEDIDGLTRMFTYADEQQDVAVKKEEKKQKALAAMELAFSIITALFQLISTGANVLNFRPGKVAGWINKFATAQKLASKWQRGLQRVGTEKFPGSSAFGKLASRRTPKPTAENPNPQLFGLLMDKSIENSQELWTITSGGWLGMQALTKEVVKGINHKKDLHGYEKTLDAVRAQLVDLDTNAVDEARDGMPILALGGRSGNGNDIIDLHNKNFSFGANVHCRAYVDFVIDMKSYATIISALWKTEGVYIIESWAANLDRKKTCYDDTRGPAENKICLQECLLRMYWVYAIINYHDKKTRSPPGWEHLTREEGSHGLFASDVVRAVLWRDEVYGPNREKDRRRNAAAPSSESSVDKDPLLNSTATKPVNLNGKGRPNANITDSPNSNGKVLYLTDYGNAPDGFDVSVCRSWFGEAISSVNSKHHRNAPCKCDPMNHKYAASWDRPTSWTMAYTKKFIKESDFYNFDDFGKKCHHCDRMEVSWKAILQLDAEEKPAKHMKRAWFGDCEPKSHKVHALGPPQLYHANSTSSPSSAAAAAAADAALPPTPTHTPIIQATTQFLAHETRYPKNTPKNITQQGACNGPYCITDSAYMLIERTYNYTVDSSERANNFSCHIGDDWCIEQSAHDLCDYFDDEDETEQPGASFPSDDEEDEREDVGPDEDEYSDFIQAAQTPDSGVSKAIQDDAEENDPLAAFIAKLKAENKRARCFCPEQGGTKGPYGISCVSSSVVTRTTTIRGRMKQSVSSGKSASSHPTASEDAGGVVTTAADELIAGTGSTGGAGRGPAPSDTSTEEVVTVTLYPDEASKAPGSQYHYTITTTVYDKRDASLEVPRLGVPTEAPVFVPSNYT